MHSFEEHFQKHTKMLNSTHFESVVVEQPRVDHDESTAKTINK